MPKEEENSLFRSIEAQKGVHCLYALCGLLPTLFIQKKRELCTVGGCGKPSHGKQYCDKHMTVEQRRKMTSELSDMIRSDCCNAKCMVGEIHENGEQYCTKCKQPCCWKVQR